MCKHCQRTKCCLGFMGYGTYVSLYYQHVTRTYHRQDRGSEKTLFLFERNQYLDHIMVLPELLHF